MKSAILAVLCIAFTLRTSGQTTTTYDTGIGHGTPLIPTVQSEIPNTWPAVVITSDYYAQPKVLVLHALSPLVSITEQPIFERVLLALPEFLGTTGETVPSTDDETSVAT